MLIRAQEMARYVVRRRARRRAHRPGLDRRARSSATARPACSRAIADLIYAKQSFGKVRWVLAAPEDSPIQVARRISKARRSPPSWCASTRAYFAAPGRQRQRRVLVGRDRSEAAGARRRDRRSHRNRLVAAREPAAHHRHGDGVEHAAHRQPDGAGRRVEADEAREHRAAAEGGDRGAGPRRADAERPPRRISQRVLALLPALQRPTISALSDDEWVAVNTIIEERTVRDLIPKLKAARRAGHRRVSAEQDRAVADRSGRQGR